MASESTTTNAGERDVFRATIIDQSITTTGPNPCLVLTVRLTGKLIDPKDPHAGNEPCAAQEVEVWITFPEAEDARLKMALRDLERLGFADDDVTRLHPEHPQAVLLLEKDVHVRRKVVKGFEYWNFVWPRERVGLSELTGAAAPLTAKIAEIRGKSRSGAPGSNGSKAGN